MVYSLSDWKQALVTLRGQFYEASQRYTGPRVCWFRLRYPEQVPFEDQRQRAEQLLGMTTKAAEYGSIVVDEDGKQHRYWCAMFDGRQEQYALFQRLAESAFTQASGGLAHKIGTIPTIMAGWPNGGYCGQPETLYMYWIGAAAFIRHTKPDPLLGLGQIYGGSLPEGGESSPVWNPPEALCSIPMVAVTHHAPFDGIVRSEIGWDGPAVLGWETRHDVWRFSVAALDKLIEASAMDPPREPAMEARYAWMYSEAIKGTAYGTIRRRLARKPKTWPKYTSDNGIKKAIVAYAERHSLPSPGARKAGSRKRTMNTN